MMKRVAAASLALALASALPLAAQAQDAPVNVTVNGRPVAFDQPPIERVGRVFVPLRGVFERLGATVVYDAGQIEATRGPTTIALHVGSLDAVVNGTTTTLDSAPFTISYRVLVPLRFVAQALGATVAYDGASRVVAIGEAAAPQAVTIITPLPAPARLLRYEPEAHATVFGLRPQIGATFPHPVDPNAVRVRLDGRDVTAASYVSSRAVSFDPSYDLPLGLHEVQITAPGIASSWPFATAAAPHPNFLRDVSPSNGTIVGHAFTVQGYTRPESHVHIVVQTAKTGFGEVASSTVTTDADTDARGRFAREIFVDDRGADVIDVRLESQAPDGVVAIRTLRLRP